MIAFLRWLRTIAFGTLNGIAKLAFFLVLVAAALFVVGLIEGDGLPSRMVLNLDLRNAPPDSSHAATFFAERRTPPTMDTVLALDRAGRDGRVKGVFLQLGGGLPIAQAEEIAAALIRFRATGRFVIAYAQGFNDPGLGDYLTAASADQIWMEPRSPFGPSGTGAGAIFLRGLFDKINAVPQIVKRADYKGAGEIVDGATGKSRLGGSEVMAGDDYADAFRAAARDHRIKAILFRIDSPGGSVTASDQILEALKEAKAAGKPVIVSMGPLAASGGYYVATAADKIVAEPATLTGSIGVLTGKVA